IRDLVGGNGWTDPAFEAKPTLTIRLSGGRTFLRDFFPLPFPAPSGLRVCFPAGRAKRLLDDFFPARDEASPANFNFRGPSRTILSGGANSASIRSGGFAFFQFLGVASLPAPGRPGSIPEAAEVPAPPLPAGGVG